MTTRVTGAASSEGFDPQEFMDDILGGARVIAHKTQEVANGIVRLMPPSGIPTAFDFCAWLRADGLRVSAAAARLGKKISHHIVDPVAQFDLLVEQIMKTVRKIGLLRSAQTLAVSVDIIDDEILGPLVKQIHPDISSKSPQEQARLLNTIPIRLLVLAQTPEYRKSLEKLCPGIFEATHEMQAEMLASATEEQKQRQESRLKKMAHWLFSQPVQGQVFEIVGQFKSMLAQKIGDESIKMPFLKIAIQERVRWYMNQPRASISPLGLVETLQADIGLSKDLDGGNYDRFLGGDHLKVQENLARGRRGEAPLKITEDEVKQYIIELQLKALKECLAPNDYQIIEKIYSAIGHSMLELAQILEKEGQLLSELEKCMPGKDAPSADPKKLQQLRLQLQQLTLRKKARQEQIRTQIDVLKRTLPEFSKA